MPNHTHLPINCDSGIREDSGLNIPLRGQLRTRLNLNRIPCYADRSATQRWNLIIASKDADATDLADYRAVITSAAIAQRRRERSANDWVSSM